MYVFRAPITSIILPIIMIHFAIAATQIVFHAQPHTSAFVARSIHIYMERFVKIAQLTYMLQIIIILMLVMPVV